LPWTGPSLLPRPEPWAEEPPPKRNRTRRRGDRRRRELFSRCPTKPGKGRPGQATTTRSALLDRDDLRQVPWLVDVRALEVGGVVREELERQNRQERLHDLGSGGDLEDVLDEAPQLEALGGSFGGDRDDLTVPRAHFLHVGQSLFEVAVLRHQDDH